MAGQLPRPYSLLFIVAQALWVQPASAQVPLPPNFISADVVHDVPSGKSASIQDLAIFAWREFIALNWVAMDPATTGIRGRPNVSVDFLSIKADTNGNFLLLVWHTYRHKNELFPADGKTDPNFDSSVPTYKYMYPATAGPNATLNFFDNLDETSEIGLCLMFAHYPTNKIRVAYEAKVNRTEFDYANKNNLTKPDSGYTTLTTALAKTRDNLAQHGGICSTGPSIVSLPCGDAAVAGDAGEGAIEIKAAWRQLTAQEAVSGRFFTQTVIFYTGPQFQRIITMRSTGWSLFTLSTKQYRFRHLCSRAGSRLTITMIRPTRTLRICSSTISCRRHRSFQIFG